MCGLLGLLTAGADAATRVEPIADALRCARHRGPDESATWNDHDLVLGFNRLSIIDVDHSHQPLHWGPVPGEDTRYTIVFNGEIYNYPELREELIENYDAAFATEGDGEVIVAAFHYWGPDAVQRLRGMFAFAIWDAVERELFVARDPFGIKPMFLATTAAGTAFASEKKSLLALAGELGIGLDLEPAALQHYLTLQYVPEPMSLNRMISRVESGTHVTVRPGEEPLHQRYFAPKFVSLPSHAPASAEAEAIVHGEIADVLRDSVAKHMRADVTVGAFLSGGIDSTAIAALAKEHNPNLITFTTGFEREGYSEVDVAAESAAAIGVRHVVRTVKPDEMMEALPLIIWYLDDPVADPALVPLWFIAREAREHVKVVLSGEGADELFGGYSIYREPLSLAPFEKVPGTLRPIMRRASRKMPEGMRGKDLLRRGSLSLEQRYYGNARIFRDDQLHEVLRGYDPRVSQQDVTAPHYFASHDWDPVARMQHVDLFTWLRGDILVKADKMTMAHSLELRVPFLDPEVFDIASSLPQSQKITHSANGTTKYALRRACEGIIPPHVLNRPKLGFPVPIRHWLRDEMYAWARDILQNSGAGHLIDLQAVHRMLDAHREGPVDHSRRIWAVLVFLIWHGIFVEKRIVPDVPTPSYPVKI
ncbi:Asparagine synthetase [glutamine-hydrolyzing] [Pseudonocardia sp. Ae168_Ps1]|uniref:asparagine synthase (glutamine-hydrolyzing) n=1 Tax=unclassified Pseudonocardia TaxID=2619320 RepID=UPI00094B68F4|nr:MULTISPECIES: asparagine synthase (glutamine-hydrolyzing) [unclassified Pseudonocardia]OLL72926.1 Asparagine synthetase [glutamine-hydrolyzing] [Pseudonocardia sp. Ae150A_Ps1]OLL78901.1 Asparagine synthetase [glutamine-hydrolyzing] [Pseudonocardia sp. Ae168_Ps1]OLL86959.1 Asparagine synthetase [glutamine-hydrolyzing] [Pseudonocardia sp. Ae263_Ps1]OLL92996.1 Asparagine synthetase [glutamine-hydrolyzing] [Pseudonocardia sp. Ae356_Ps1]